MGKPDTGGKKIINIYNQAWVEWLLQQQHVKVEAELSGEFQFVARATDSLLQVNSPQGRFLALTELQFRYDPEMPDRLTVYAALARQKYRHDVFVTVIYLLPPPTDVAITGAFHREFMGQVAHQDFQVIALWELDANQVLAYNNPALLPFVPLMRGGNTEQMLRKCAERIRQEPQADELEAILALFASYVLDTALIKQIVRWEMEIIQESSFIRELREEWLERGERKATLKALRRTLTIRFSIDLEKFEPRLEQVDLATLEQLNEMALTAQNLQEFEAALTEILSKLENKQADA